MAMKVDPVPLGNFPPTLATTQHVKELADALKGHADAPVKLLAHAAWMVCEALEVGKADLPLAGPEVEALYDHDRSMKRVQAVAVMKELTGE